MDSTKHLSKPLLLLIVLALAAGAARAEEEEIPVVPRDLGEARKQMERFVTNARALKQEQDERKRIEEETAGTIESLVGRLKEESARKPKERDREKIRDLRKQILDEYRKRLEQFAGPETDALVKLALQRDAVISSVGYMSDYLGQVLDGYGEPGAVQRIASRLEQRRSTAREQLQSEFSLLAAKGLYDPDSRTFSDGIPEATVRRIGELRARILQDERVLGILGSTRTPERFVQNFRKIRRVLEIAKGRIRDLYDRLEDQRALVVGKLNEAIEYLRVVETVEDMEDFVRGMSEAIRSLEEVSGAIDGVVESLDVYVTEGLDSAIEVPDLPGAEGETLQVDRSHTLLRALELLESKRREER